MHENLGENKIYKKKYDFLYLTRPWIVITLVL